MDIISQDFAIAYPSLVKTETLQSDTNVGFTDRNKKVITTNKTFLDGTIAYTKGNGKLSWHTAHEYMHLVQYQIMMKEWTGGYYSTITKARNDFNRGTGIWKGLLIKCNNKANKLEGTKKTIYERLNSISLYANPKNTFINPQKSWLEGHCETVGRYIQSGKDSNDIFGKLVYDETIRRFTI